LNIDVDYMVGAQLEGYDCMVKLTEENNIMILEGDEYLSSPIDRRPKFHLYKPHVALISGIAWDHINVFPTFENYVEQFELFCDEIEPNGVLIYNDEDKEVSGVAKRKTSTKIAKVEGVNSIPYGTPKYNVTEKGTLLFHEGKEYSLQIFGAHNLQNLMGAMNVCKQIGISSDNFFNAMYSFTGAGKRLEKVVEKGNFTMFKDFAHSPSKLKATTAAVKEQFKDRKVMACMELHTFSSLKKEFLPQYKGAMENADEAIVYFSPAVVAHKNLEPISVTEVQVAFGGNVKVFTETKEVLSHIRSQSWDNAVLLMMSSGNFDGIDYKALGDEI